ncbi:tetratricopeptide repeat protein [Flavobacterium hauense]
MKKIIITLPHIVFTCIIMLFFASCTKDEKHKATVGITQSMRTTEGENNKGINQWQKGNYSDALEHFTKSYNLAKKNKDTVLIGTLLNNMGLVNWSMGNNDAAMECYKEASVIAEQLGDKSLLGLTHTNQSLILKQEKKFDEAFEHNNKAIALFKELNDSRSLAIAYNNQGQLYRASGQLDAALDNYFLSLGYCNPKEYPEGEAIAFQNLASVYREKGAINKALKPAHLALKLSYKLGNKVRISEACLELSWLHEKLHRNDSALYYFKKHYDLTAEIMYKNQDKQLAKNQAKLGMEVKNLRIDNLQKEKEIAKNQLLVIIAGIVVLLVLIGFFVYRYFSIMRFKKRQLELELLNSQQIIEIKEQELKTYIIDLSKKNAVISSLQEETTETEVPVNPTEEEIAILLEQKILTDDDWETFRARFMAIYPGFFARIKANGIQLTEAETRLLVLMRLELNSKDMANILGISPQSVRVCKMRLKKKLPADKYESVEDFLAELTR